MSHRPLAILVSDLHIRHTVPSARAENCWYTVMEAYFRELDRMRTRLGVPIICAGDVFDKWNPPAELVSWALDHVPKMFAIPGQHDLPGHSHDLRHQGAYGALVKAYRIIDLEAEAWTKVDDKMCVWAMPWGRYTLPETRPACTSLAVMHKYMHIGSDATTRYYGAPEEATLEAWEKNYPLFDAVLAGDNHIPWQVGSFLNHGGFIPQNSDQRDKPASQVGVLYDDNTIAKVALQVPEPQWAEPSVVAASTNDTNTKELIEELKRMDSPVADFGARIRQAATTAANQEARKILQQMIEELA